MFHIMFLLTEKDPAGNWVLFRGQISVFKCYLPTAVTRNIILVSGEADRKGLEYVKKS